MNKIKFIYFGLVIFLLILFYNSSYKEKDLSFVLTEKLAVDEIDGNCTRSNKISREDWHIIDKEIYSLPSIDSFLNSFPIKLNEGGVSLSIENSKCQSNTNIAIIIPYRDRLANLKVFLKNMHVFLTKQNINYGIYLIEPVDNIVFNRGILMNIGFKEALKDRLTENGLNWNCFFFHDADMIPETLGTLYKCVADQPVHYATCVSKYNYKLEILILCCYFN
jgi:hypothetical protein